MTTGTGAVVGARKAEGGRRRRATLHTARFQVELANYVELNPAPR